MKFTIFVDKEREEEVVVYTHKENDFTDSLRKLCEEENCELLGYCDDTVTRLSPSEIYCFTVLDNKLYAITENKKYILHKRLYQVEALLSESYIKLNQSTIANIEKIQCFDATFSGSLKVVFKNGYTDYVSRRNMKNIKERFGL